MNTDDIKLIAFNSLGIGVTFTDIEVGFKIVLMITSLWYAISRVIEQRKQHKMNDLKRKRILEKNNG